MKNYISKKMKNWKERNIHGVVPIVIVHPFPEYLDIDNIVDIIEKTIPSKLCAFVEGVYVGKFEELEQRDIQAMYNDGVVYLSNYENEQGVTTIDIAQNFTHELGHAIEQKFGNEIYGDGSIEEEYFSKMKDLSSILIGRGYKFDIEKLLSSEFDLEIDEFLFKEVGYENLSQFTINLFLSPYASTSISEYYADLFEDYFYSTSHRYMKRLCPCLFDKISHIVEVILDGNYSN